MTLKPFLRWAGGKSWAAEELVAFARTIDGGRPVAYCEPFLGGGSMLLAMLGAGLVAKDRCYIGDLAPESFMIWKGVLHNPVRTAMHASRCMVEATDGIYLPADGYLHLRRLWNSGLNNDLAWMPDKRDPSLSGTDLCEVAGLLIAINRLSYKGLLRVNSRGCFNTPYGHLPNPTIDIPAIVAAGQAMRAAGVMLIPGSWRDIVNVACVSEPYGLIAVDPPYAGTTHTAYTKRGWNALDRVQLSERCRTTGWSMFATDADLPDSWDAWRWAGPVSATRRGGMGDGDGGGIENRGEIMARHLRVGV